MESPLHVPVEVLLRRFDQSAVIAVVEPRVQLLVRLLPRSADYDASIRSRNQIIECPIAVTEHVTIVRPLRGILGNDTAADSASRNDLVFHFWYQVGGIAVAGVYYGGGLDIAPRRRDQPFFATLLDFEDGGEGL